MADISDDKAEEVKKDESVPDASVKKPDDVKRIKQANKTLQKERDDFKAKLDKHEKDLADAKLSAEEKAAKALAAKEIEIETARAEAKQAKREREFERAISKLVTKHNLADPDYGELVLKGWDPEADDDLDSWVAEQKKRPSIANLFKKAEAKREVDEDGGDIVPKVAGSGSAKKATSNWEETEREIAKSLYPNNKERQDNYIAGVRKLKAEGK